MWKAKDEPSPASGVALAMWSGSPASGGTRVNSTLAGIELMSAGQMTSPGEMVTSGGRTGSNGMGPAMALWRTTPWAVGSMRYEVPAPNLATAEGRISKMTPARSALVETQPVSSPEGAQTDSGPHSSTASSWHLLTCVAPASRNGMLHAPTVRMMAEAT